MGLFDTLREMKARHDYEVAQAQEKAEREWEREKQAKAAREQAILDHLESGELMQAVVGAICSIPWFGESQGSWDSNRRKVMVAKNGVIVNNHDTDALFELLTGISNQKGGVKFSFYEKEETIANAYLSGKLGIGYSADQENRINARRLEKYAENDNYAANAYMFEDLGYDPIEDWNMQRKFASVLRTVLAKRFPGLEFSEPASNGHGIFGFETKVQEKRGKSVLPEHLR